MNFIKELKKVYWARTILFYALILIGTYFSRKLPNLLNIVLRQISDIHFPWNYNHGIIILLISFLFYRFSKIKQEITLLGNNKARSILFPIILSIGYSIYGISNDQGVDKHLWALLFCVFTFVYDLMEEYTWRGYLIESLGKIHFIFKSLISGVFWAIWHLFIFKDFEQYGGFGIFLIFCIVFSFILTFSALRTKSIIVPATIHALLIRTNMVTLICFIIFMLFLLTWDWKIKRTQIS